MESTKLQQLSAAYRRGMSIHAIARQYQLSYASVRYQLIKHAVYKPRTKYTVGAKILCRLCSRPFVVNRVDSANSRPLCRVCMRERQLKHDMRKLGTTADKYYALLCAQKNKCAICKTKIGHRTKYGHAARLALDHCHVSGVVRGLLCNR